MKRKQSEYEKLRKVWYKKLADTGFVDIETSSTISSNRGLRFSRTENYGQYSHEWRKSKEEYYTMATRFLNDYPFKTNIDRVIWEYHSNGMSCQNIADTLKKAKLFKHGMMTIWRKIQKFKSEMKNLYVSQVEYDQI